MTESTRTYYYLKYYAKHIGEFCEDKQFIPSVTFNNVKNLLKTATVVLTQLKIILNSCPTEEVLGNEIPEMPMPEENVTFKHCEDWTKATHLITNTLSTVKKLNTFLLKCENLMPYTEYDLVIPDFVPLPDLAALKNDLSIIQGNVESLQGILCENISTTSLEYLKKYIEKVLSQLDDDDNDDLNETSVSPQEVSRKIEKLTENILVVIQNMYKKYTSNVEEPKKSEEEEEESEEIQDEHLKKLLIENLSDDMATLDMKKILKNVHKISRLLFKASPKLHNLRDIVARCVPFLEQILYLYQYFITQQVSAYRVTCKVTSILLNIFIELASKVSTCSGELDSFLVNSSDFSFLFFHRFIICLYQVKFTVNSRSN